MPQIVITQKTSFTTLSTQLLSKTEIILFHSHLLYKIKTLNVSWRSIGKTYEEKNFITIDVKPIVNS